jgi:hypothetical protein
MLNAHVSDRAVTGCAVGFLSARLQHCTVSYVVTEVSEAVASIYRVEVNRGMTSSVYIEMTSFYVLV